MIATWSAVGVELCSMLPGDGEFIFNDLCRPSAIDYGTSLHLELENYTKYLFWGLMHVNRACFGLFGAPGLFQVRSQLPSSDDAQRARGEATFSLSRMGKLCVAGLDHDALERRGMYPLKHCVHQQSLRNFALVNTTTHLDGAVICFCTRTLLVICKLLF